MGYGSDWLDEEDDDLYDPGCPGCGAIKDEDCICEEYYDDDELVEDEDGYPD